MFKRYAPVGLMAAMLISVVWSVLGAASVFAAGESYSWRDYSTIGAKNGMYSLGGRSTEGGVAAVEFKQSKDNPNLFEANFGAENCNLKISLNLALDGKSGVVSATPTGGNCNPAELDSQVTIGNASLVTSKVDADSKTMQKEFYDKECTVRDQTNSEAANQEEATCRDDAEAKYTAAINECKVEADYAQSPQLSNKFLDCLSKKLGVERPGTKKPDENTETKKIQCAISDNIGWMVCQILQFEAWVADYSFKLLSQFLEVEPLRDEINTATAVGQPDQAPAETPAQTCQPATPGSSNLEVPSESTPEAQQPSAENCEQNQVNTQLPETEGDETYTHAAWRFMLGFTNLIFVFVFLFAIVSYLTGWGVSQYNIKSLLPRYIVTAILVNMSFFICAIAVDISNILGRSVQDTIVNFTSEQVSQSTSWEVLTESTLSRDVTDSEPAQDENSGEETTNGQPTAPNEDEERKQREESQGPDETLALESEKPSAIKIAGVTLFGAAVLVLLLVILVPLMTAALIAMVVTLLVLLLRQAVIIMLVVVAPIAFALYLLPNTRSWFTKWRTLFVTLLILYPVISLIYGASYLAATVVQDRALENDEELMQMFSLAIMVMPLFMTPALMKLGGGLLNRFAGIVNNPNKGPFDRLRKEAQGYQEFKRNRRTANALASPENRNLVGKFGFLRRHNASRLLGRNQANALLGNAKKKYNGSQTTPSGAERGLTKADGFREDAVEEAFAFAAQDLDEVVLGEMHAATARWRSEGLRQEDYENMALSGQKDGKALTSAEHAAAAKAALNGKNEKKAEEIIAKSGQIQDGLVRRVIAQNAGQYGAHYGGSARAAIAEGRVGSREDIDNMLVKTASSGKLGAETMTKQSDYIMGRYQELMSRDETMPGAMTPAGSENIRRAAKQVKGADKLSGKLNGAQQQYIERWSRQ